MPASRGSRRHRRSPSNRSAAASPLRTQSGMPTPRYAAPASARPGSAATRALDRARPARGARRRTAASRAASARRARAPARRRCRAARAARRARCATSASSSSVDQLGPARAADEGAQQLVAVGRAARDTSGSRRCRRAAPGARRGTTKPKPASVPARRRRGSRASPSPTRRTRWRRARARARASSGASSARGGERRRRDDHGVGVERLAAGRQRASARRRAPAPAPPRAAGRRPSGSRRATASTSAPMPSRGRDEQAVARARAAARAPRRRRAQPEDHAAVRALHLEEARHGRGERQALGIGGVDAADERLGDALERLAAEPAADEGGEALVAGAGARGSTRSSAMRSFPRQREERRASPAARAPSAPAAGSPRAAAAGGRRARRTVRRSPSRVPTSRSAKPRRSQSARPHGFSVMNESAPRSTTKPPRALGARSLPPSRSRPRAGRRRPARPRCACSTRRCAAARPAMPPPTTTTRRRLTPARSRTTSASMRMKRGWSFTVPARAKRQAEALGRRARLDVEVVEHLDVVADEADRATTTARAPSAASARERVVDVGLEPRIARAAAAALVGDLPAARAPRRSATARAGRVELGDVRRALRHRRPGCCAR